MHLLVALGVIGVIFGLLIFGDREVVRRVLIILGCLFGVFLWWLAMGYASMTNSNDHTMTYALALIPCVLVVAVPGFFILRRCGPAVGLVLCSFALLGFCALLVHMFPAQAMFHIAIGVFIGLAVYQLWIEWRVRRQGRRMARQQHRLLYPDMAKLRAEKARYERAAALEAAIPEHYSLRTEIMVMGGIALVIVLIALWAIHTG